MSWFSDVSKALEQAVTQIDKVLDIKEAPTEQSSSSSASNRQPIKVASFTSYFNFNMNFVASLRRNQWHLLLCEQRWTLQPSIQ
jgi:uncharacterized membrane protein YgcG